MNHKHGQTFLPLKAHTQSLLISALQPCSSPLPCWCVSGATAKLCNSTGSTDKLQFLSCQRRAWGRQIMAGLTSNICPVTVVWLPLEATTFPVPNVSPYTSCKVKTNSAFFCCAQANELTASVPIYLLWKHEQVFQDLQQNVSDLNLWHTTNLIRQQGLII